MMPAEVSTAIGHYKIVKELGCSRLARVYLAEAEAAGQAQPVALKVLDESAGTGRDFLNQLRAEVRAVAKLKHPHIMPIYGTSKGQAKPFFVAMAYVKGGTLRERLKNGPLSRAEAVRMAEQVGAALSHAHAHQVIHGDVRPGNILLDTSQNPAQCLLTDFGWAREWSAALLKKGDRPGQTGPIPEAYSYMAPEQWELPHTLTPATDIYGLAITLFEMLAGRPPFEAAELSALGQKHLREPLPRLSQVAYRVGPFFDELLIKATAKEPAQRYQNVANFINAVQAANEEVEQAERAIRQRRAVQAIKMAHTYLTTDHYNLERALALAEKALRLYPGYAEAHRVRAEIRLTQEQFAEALEDFEQAYQPAPGASGAYLAALKAKAASEDLREKVRRLQAGHPQENIVKIEAVAPSSMPAEGGSVPAHTEPQKKAPEAAPTFNPLWLLLLIPLVTLFTLCTIAYGLVNRQVTSLVVEQADALLNTPAPGPSPLLTTSVTTPSLSPAPATAGPISVTPTAFSISPLPAIATPAPTSMPPPTATPSPAPVFGIVTIPASQRLNVREGPDVAYNIVARLENGAKILLLRRTPDGNWLEIEIAGQATGWVASQYVELIGDIDSVGVAANLPLIPATSWLLPFDIEGGSVSGQLGPGQTQWYSFFDENKETILVFIFTPPLKSNQVQFFLYDQGQIATWPPNDPEAIAHIGASSYPASDRDGNERTGELIWRGGPLIPGVRYYLRFVNRSNHSIEYCLAPRDAYQWSCP